MKLKLNNMEIHVWDGVYPPSDDTFLIMDHVDLTGRERVLDVGTGTGILAIFAALKGCHVVAVDVSKKAIANARLNAKINNVVDLIDFVCCDLMTPFRSTCNFDVVMMNPPYLPSYGHPKVNSHLWSGGKSGIELTMRAISQLSGVLKRGGRFYFVTSTLSKYQVLLSRLSSLSFIVHIKAKKRFWFEEILLVEAIKNASHKSSSC